MCEAWCCVQTQRLRFDFNLARGMTPHEVHRVEEAVNGWIQQDHPLTTHLVPLQEAKAKGGCPPPCLLCCCCCCCCATCVICACCVNECMAGVGYVCCAVLCCAALRCVALCCAVLCCAILCCTGAVLMLCVFFKFYGAK